MDIIRKYHEVYRSLAKDGDILLWRGNGFLAKAIRYFDNHYYNNDGKKIKSPAYYNHASFVVWNRGRLENVDSWVKGITKVPVSYRIRQYEDFCVMRLKNIQDSDMQKTINECLERWDAGIGYDYFYLLQAAVYKKFGINILWMSSKIKDVCSEFIQKRFCIPLGIQCYQNIHINLIAAQDFIRYANKDEIEIFFNDSVII